MSSVELRLLRTVLILAGLAVLGTTPLPGLSAWLDWPQPALTKPLSHRTLLFGQALYPYFMAAVATLWLSGMIPALRRLRDGDESEQARFDRMIVWITLPIAIGFGLRETVRIGPYLGLLGRDFWSLDGARTSWILIATASSTAAVYLLLYLARVIDRFGVGSGVLMVSLAVSMPQGLVVAVSRAAVADARPIGQLVVAAVLVGALVAWTRAVTTMGVRSIGTEEPGDQPAPGRPEIRIRYNLLGWVPTVIATTLASAFFSLTTLAGMDAITRTLSQPVVWFIVTSVLVVACSIVMTAIMCDSDEVAPILRRWGYTWVDQQHAELGKQIDAHLERVVLPRNIAVLVGLLGLQMLVEHRLATKVDHAMIALSGPSGLLLAVAIVAAKDHWDAYRRLEPPRPVENDEEAADEGGEAEAAAEADDSGPTSEQTTWRRIIFPEQPEWVSIFSPPTTLEAELARCRLEEAGVAAVVLPNAGVAVQGSVTPWEWTVPKYPALVIHRRLGGSAASTLVRTSDRDRAEKVLREVRERFNPPTMEV